MSLDNITISGDTILGDFEIQINFSDSDPLEDFIDECLAEEDY